MSVGLTGGLATAVESLRHEVERLRAVLERMDRELMERHNYAVEKCAQVADGYRVEGQCGENNEACLYIAAAIRALKSNAGG